jgi:hypothetical protein
MGAIGNPMVVQAGKDLAAKVIKAMEDAGGDPSSASFTDDTAYAFSKTVQDWLEDIRNVKVVYTYVGVAPTTPPTPDPLVSFACKLNMAAHPLYMGTKSTILPITQKQYAEWPSSTQHMLDLIEESIKFTGSLQFVDPTMVGAPLPSFNPVSRITGPTHVLWTNYATRAADVPDPDNKWRDMERVCTIITSAIFDPIMYYNPAPIVGTHTAALVFTGPLTMVPLAYPAPAAP